MKFNDSTKIYSNLRECLCDRKHSDITKPSNNIHPRDLRVIMNPLFQLSTRSYDKEIILVKQALADLEKECDESNGHTIDAPFEKFGWTFFNIQISEKMAEKIEKSGMMKGALGFKIGEQMTNFIGHYLETKGSNVRIKKIDY